MGDLGEGFVECSEGANEQLLRLSPQWERADMPLFKHFLNMRVYIFLSFGRCVGNLSGEDLLAILTQGKVCITCEYAEWII